MSVLYGFFLDEMRFILDLANRSNKCSSFSKLSSLKMFIKFCWSLKLIQMFFGHFFPIKMRLHGTLKFYQELVHPTKDLIQLSLSIKTNIFRKFFKNGQIISKKTFVRDYFQNLEHLM